MTGLMMIIRMIVTIIDSFTASTKQTISRMEDTAFGNSLNFGPSSAMSWIDSIMILLPGVVTLMMRRVARKL